MDYRELQATYELPLYPMRDICLVKGKGAKVWDSEGREYIDCAAGNGVVNVGHCNPDVVRAICEQAQTLITCGGGFYNDKRAEILEKLVSISPPHLTRAFLCNSGTESVEAAIKFSRLSTGRTDIVAHMRGFHGRTLGALSATFNPKYREGFAPLVPGFSHVPLNKIEKLEEKVTDQTAAVILEIVQGEGGVNVAHADYLQSLQKVCADRGALLIIDEVQTGFGRTGKMFACEHFDIQPDILCIAKAIAGGVPMGAVLCSEKISVSPGKHGTTFGGNPLSCAAALASISFTEQESLPTQAVEKGAYFMNRLREIDSPKIREVRGLGLMVGVELKEKSTQYLVTLM
ncbi:MAG: acetylornithine/succinylornithine family transaminase, partial [Bdellovibrionales bacterium]|nr:acetylornithine/succinylornithine family transaminase [Bdellovibrionales bacterium]